MHLEAIHLDLSVAQGLLKEREGYSSSTNWSVASTVQELEARVLQYETTVHRLEGVAGSSVQALATQKAALLEQHDQELMQLRHTYADSTIGQMQVWLELARARQARGGMIAFRRLVGQDLDLWQQQAIGHWWRNKVR